MFTRITAALVALYIVAGGPNAVAPTPDPIAQTDELAGLKSTLAGKALDFCLSNPVPCTSLAQNLSGQAPSPEKPVATGSIRAQETAERLADPVAAPTLPVPPRRRSAEKP
ncbi:hypothetical protein MCEMSEM23_00718 [Rhabdaerophilaceae bacterium]